MPLVLGWQRPPAPPPRDSDSDSDGDGLGDARDRCPRLAAAGADGCPPPDADGAGVPDTRDRCPRARRPRPMAAPCVTPMPTATACPTRSMPVCARPPHGQRLPAARSRRRRGG
ncbi:MAG: thrombospondin type 3 repeat-containing protein [Proteobacteria bacterium]|nr:thrombospondin type 3 repeat-containing protein [Pseudomonadota bacterium]